MGRLLGGMWLEEVSDDGGAKGHQRQLSQLKALHTKGDADNGDAK